MNRNGMLFLVMERGSVFLIRLTQDSWKYSVIMDLKAVL